MTAARQHAAVSHAQLIDAGLTMAGIKHRVAAGWLYRKHRGVYAVGHPRLTPRGRWMAAILAGGEEAVLSHRSAGALWGPCLDAKQPEITVPRRKRPDTRVHAAAIGPGDTVVVDGIRVTKVARTLLDLAEVLTHDQLVEAIDKATNHRQLRPTLMSSMIKQSRGRRGLKPLKQARLPAPEVNVPLHGYEVDLLWRDHRLVIELDGSEYHDPERDSRKTNNLMARGWTVRRFTWRQVVNDPDWVTEVLIAGGELPRAAA